MKAKKLVFALLLMAIACNIQAQEKNYPTGSVLWKISGKNLDKPSYILGTFHLKSGEYLDEIPGARAALESSEQVVGEVVMNNMQEIMAEIMPKMMMPADTTYHLLYSDEDYNYVSQQIRPYLGAGLDQLGVMKPFALDMTVSVLIYSKVIPGFNPQNLLDMYVQQEAEKNHKPVLGLETADIQINILGVASLQRQADKLLCSLKNSDTIITNELKTLVASYDKGDLQTLSDLFLKEKDSPCPSTPEEMDKLIKERNDQWMQKLPAIMQEKSSFIAVGAGHLVGESGLLNQLQQQGYTVESVTK